MPPLENGFRCRWLPSHFVKVNVAAGIDDVVAADEVYLPIRSEDDRVSPVELDLDNLNVCPVELLNRFNVVLNFALMLQYLTLVASRQEWLLKLIYAVLLL